MIHISVAIPHYNNSCFIKDLLDPLLKDERINEIIICDDYSNDYTKLKEIINSIDNDKIKLYRNENNIGCYHNKLNTITKCTNEWSILIDSDNIINKDYIDELYALEWNDNCIYAPMWAKTFPGEISPNLNYSIYRNILIDKQICAKEYYNIKMQCLMNTCNYFIPVKKYIETMKKYKYDRMYIDAIDSLILFTDWIKNNNKILVVDNLIYKHRLHKNSNYVKSQSHKYSKNIIDKIYIDLKN